MHTFIVLSINFYGVATMFMEQPINPMRQTLAHRIAQQTIPARAPLDIQRAPSNHPMWAKATNPLAPRWSNWWEYQSKNSVNAPTTQQCMDAVTQTTSSLCFASGGKNEKMKELAQNMYDSGTWASFLAYNKVGCYVCPSIGYWPDEEQSAMIFCQNDDADGALGNFCVDTGIKLFQDAVLYRPAQQVQVYILSTCSNPTLGCTTPAQGTNWDASGVITGTFWKPKQTSGDFGTAFINEDQDKDVQGKAASKFLFASDNWFVAYCRTCTFYPGFGSSAQCVGADGRNGLCNIKCTYCDNKNAEQGPCCRRQSR